MIRRFPVVVCLVALAACAGSDDEADQTSTTRLTLLPTTTTTLPPPTTAPAVPTTSTTTTSTTTTTTSTTTTLSPEQVDDIETSPAVEALVLRGDGIGGAAFSAEPEGVIAYISSFLGTPTADTGWVDPFAIGACSGNELRFVAWGVLTLTFGDVSQVLQGQRHFYAYEYGIPELPGASPAGLVTDSGVALGSRLVDLLAAYPQADLNPPDDFTPPSFFVNNNFRGYLSGLADDSAVTVVFGGQGCGE